MKDEMINWLSNLLKEDVSRLTTLEVLEKISKLWNEISDDTKEKIYENTR